MRPSWGQPAWGAHLADHLENLIALHDASNIAAVIVEPLAGSTGVLIPPQGYLERLRQITSKHGILLIFDEVITAFGRLGDNTASEYFHVIPDLITLAKGISNAAVPAGAVAVRRDKFASGADKKSVRAITEFSSSGTAAMKEQPVEPGSHSQSVASRKAGAPGAESWSCRHPRRKAKVKSVLRC